MSEKRKYTNTTQLVLEHGEDIASRYEKGVTVGELADHFETSRNTMVMVLSDLGFPSPTWAQPITEKRAERLKRVKERRTRTVEDSE